MSANPRSLSPSAKRALAALLLLALLLAAIAAIAIPAWKLHEHYNFSIASLTRRYTAQTSANAARPQLLKSVEALQAKDNKRFLLKGTTPVLATAELLEIANGAIEGNGIVCREDGEWLLEGRAAADDSNEELLAIIERLGGSPPLDSEAERQIIAGNWRP